MSSPAYFHERYLRIRDRWNAARRAKYAANPEPQKAASLAYRRTHPLTSEKQKLKLVRHQEKVAGRPRPAGCDVCGGPPKGRGRLHFDHDHATGAFRGWLCHNCNAALGHAHDDIEVLEKLIVYLARSRRPKLLRLTATSSGVP